MHSSDASPTRPGWAQAALVSLALIAGPFLVTPVVLHSANQLNFNVDLLRALTGPLALGLVTFLLLTPLLQRSARLAAVALAVALLFWIQGQVLVWDYGVLDGRAIDWSERAWRGFIDGLLWITVLLGAWAAADRLRPVLGTISLALLAIYAVTLGGSLWNRTPAPAFHHYTLDETHKYDFSGDQNVVLLVLDAFQSDIFQELLDTRPELFDAFDGFTYYRNASSGFAKTYPSIPLMFTGEWFDNSEPITDFVERSFLEHSVTTQLVAEGWRVDLFPDIPRVVHHDERVASNVLARNDPIIVAEDSGRLTDLSLFRVSPHFLKRFWLNNDQWRLSTAWATAARTRTTTTPLRQADHPNGAARFALSALQYGRVTWEQPAFKFYHLMVPHEPFLLREDFSVKRWPAGREGYLGQSAATLVVLEQFLDALKNLEIDDRTSVIVVADHGGGDYNAGVRTGAVVPEPEPSSSPAMSAQYHASALPLVLVRPAGTTGALQVSDVPVSIGDVAATLAREAALPGDHNGAIAASGTRSAGQEARERPYYFYRHQGWDGDFLPPMEEFTVKGHSWDLRAWAPTGRIIAPGGRIERTAGLKAGTRVDFDGQGLTGTWLREGWSGAEPSGTWSAASRAMLQIPLDLGSDAPAPTHVHLWLTPFRVPGQLDEQRARLSLTPPGHQRPFEIADWRVNASGCYSAALPPEWASDSQSTETLGLELELPDAAAPNDFGLSGDFRLLGVRLMALELGAARSVPLAKNLGSLSDARLDCALQRAGWVREGSAFVSTAPRAQLVLRLPDTIPANTTYLDLRAEALPFLADGQLEEQPLTVRSGDVTLLKRSLVAAEQITLRIPIDPDTASLTLDFNFPEATTPASLGLNSDQRALAIRLQDLELTTGDTKAP